MQQDRNLYLLLCFHVSPACKGLLYLQRKKIETQDKSEDHFYEL